MNAYKVKFDPKHLEIMEIREHEFQSAILLKDSFERIKRVANFSTEAFTFVYDGRIIMCGGFFEVWPGVLEGWLIPSKHIDKAPIFFAKHTKRYVEALAKTFKCHRFQTTSPANAFHEHWMNWLGFTKEGTMKAYTHDKKDYAIYGRLFTWPS